jgi:hypothetical protein
MGSDASAGLSSRFAFVASAVAYRIGGRESANSRAQPSEWRSGNEGTLQCGVLATGATDARSTNCVSRLMWHGSAVQASRPIRSSAATHPFYGHRECRRIRRMPGIADFTIDNGTPAGEAMVRVETVKDPAGPPRPRPSAKRVRSTTRAATAASITGPSIAPFWARTEGAERLFRGPD